MKDLLSERLSVYCQRRSYRAGEAIFIQGDRSDCFYYLEQGEVQGLAVLADGRQQSVRTNWARSFFAIPTFIKQIPRPIMAQAMKDSQVLVINRAAYLQCCQQVLGFRELLLDALSEEIESMFSRLAAIKLFSSEVNVARFLCRRVASGEYQGGAEQPVLACTQDYIAGTIGISRLTVSNVLHQFQARGWLRLGYRQLEILDYPALEKVAYNQEWPIN